MALIVLASDKGSPGVTTSAVALAGVWPRRAILAECDPSGGDLVYRSPAENGGPLNPNVGMLSLATMARHGLSAHQLGDHLQRIHGGLEIIAGLATGDQSAGLTGLWPHLGRAFDALPDTDVIADCGRVDAASASLELMSGAALIVLVARTSAEQIAHVRDRALSLVQRVGGGNALASGGLGVPIGVVLIVDPKQRARVTAQVDELLRHSGLPVKVIGTLADDPDGADLLNGRGRGRLDKTLLIRSAREVSLDLYRRFATAGQGTASTPGRPVPPPPGPRPTLEAERPGPTREAERPAPPRTDPGPGPAPAPGGPRDFVRPSAPTFDAPTVRTPIPPNGFGDRAAPPPFQTTAPAGPRPVPPSAPSEFDTRPLPIPGRSAPHYGTDIPEGFDASSNSFDPAVPTGRRALPPTDGRDRDRNREGGGGHRAGPPQQGVR